MGKKFIVSLLLLIAVPELLSCNKNEDKPIPEVGVYETIINLETGERQFAYLSNVYEVEGIYNSMKGPSSVTKISLMESDELELLWIMGYSATMVESGGGPSMSQKFMGHSNIDFDAKTHKMLFYPKGGFYRRGYLRFPKASLI